MLNVWFIIFDKLQGKVVVELLKVVVVGEIFDVLFMMQVVFWVNMVLCVIKVKQCIGFDWLCSKELYWLFVNKWVVVIKYVYVFEGFMDFVDVLGVFKFDMLIWNIFVIFEDVWWVEE